MYYSFYQHSTFDNFINKTEDIILQKIRKDGIITDYPYIRVIGFKEKQKKYLMIKFKSDTPSIMWNTILSFEVL